MIRNEKHRSRERERETHRCTCITCHRESLTGLSRIDEGRIVREFSFVGRMCSRIIVRGLIVDGVLKLFSK